MFLHPPCLASKKGTNVGNEGVNRVTTVRECWGSGALKLHEMLQFCYGCPFKMGKLCLSVF